MSEPTGQYLAASTRPRIPHPTVLDKPLLRIEGAPICADFNFSFLIKQQIWVGLSFRTGVGIVTYLQYKITDKFKIGYAYDIGLNKLGASSNEIMISYDIKVFKKPAFISPRYF